LDGRNANRLRIQWIAPRRDRKKVPFLNKHRMCNTANQVLLSSAMAQYEGHGPSWHWQNGTAGETGAANNVEMVVKGPAFVIFEQK